MTVLRLFLDICLFRKGPQDIPASSFLFRLTVIIYLIVGFIFLQLGTTGLKALTETVFETFIALGFVWGLLAFTKKTPRFRQTATSLLGSDALISSLAMPFMAAINYNAGAGGPYLIMLVLLIWHISVIGHILRHALSSNLTFGLGIALVYVFMSYQIVALFV